MAVLRSIGHTRLRDVRALASVLSLTFIPRALADNPGTFVGRIVTQWETDGRQMTLLEPFQFVDPRGRRWSVPRGITVDGASIPPILWSIIGGPFEGKYRVASI